MKSGGDEKPSLPALPAKQDTQLQILLPSESKIQGIEPRAGPEFSSNITTSVEDFQGYLGVSLEVTFCRYTI